MLTTHNQGSALLLSRVYSFECLLTRNKINREKSTTYFTQGVYLLEGQSWALMNHCELGSKEMERNHIIVALYGKDVDAPC